MSIGSGATAVTLLPVLSEKAKHVTMLQRSPSYIVSVPATDTFVAFVRAYLPSFVSAPLSRWWNVLIPLIFYYICRWFPHKMKSNLMAETSKELKKPKGYVSKHFNPKYNPW